jgi:hypothetical protein
MQAKENLNSPLVFNHHLVRWDRSKGAINTQPASPAVTTEG